MERCHPMVSIANKALWAAIAIGQYNDGLTSLL